MNDKEKALAEQIGVAIEEIWTNYYTEEDIGVGDIEPKAAVQYERLIDNIAEIIYKVGESNREVHMIKDLDAFEKAMQEKYPYLVEIRDEEVVDCDDGKKERYTAWLKFPYYSTDSDGGFFSFFSEEEFEQYMTSSIRMFTEEEIKNKAFEACQYAEFYDDAVFDLDKALYLFYKARMEMEKYLLKNGTIVEMYDGSKGIIQGNDFENSETFNDVNYYVYPIADVEYCEMHLAQDIILFYEKEDKQMNSEELDKYLDENLPKVKFDEPKVFKVTIEEHINQTFEVEAADMEEAMELAKERYYKGEYVLEGDVNVSARLVSVEDDNGDFVNWYEF